MLDGLALDIVVTGCLLVDEALHLFLDGDILLKILGVCSGSLTFWFSLLEHPGIYRGSAELTVIDTPKIVALCNESAL